MHDEPTRIAVLRLARRTPRPSIRAIAKALGISRESVDAILASGESTVRGLERSATLDPHLEQVQNLFVVCRGNRVRVHEKLADDGIDVPYATLTAFCRRHGIGHKPKPPAGQYHFEPGEEMQHDTSPHKVEIGGRKRSMHCASLVLCFSMRIYAQVYPRWDRFYAKAFLTEAFCWFDGVAGRGVVDNSSVIIAYGNGVDAVPAPEMVAFAERYDFDWLAHELGDADRSARVERPFSYIEGNFYSGRTFADLADLNQQLRDWCTKNDHKRKRRLQTTPIALYQTERPALKRLPIHVPEVYDLVWRTVDLEGFVHYWTNRYSVPADLDLIGHEVEVRATLSTVRVIVRRNVVAEHVRIEDGMHASRTLPGHGRKRRGPASSAPPIAEEGPLRAASPELAALVDALRKRHGGRAVRPIRRLHRMFLEYPTESLVAGVAQALEYGLLDLERIEHIVLRRVSGDFFRQALEDRNG
jgi:hypothetical protein